MEQAYTSHGETYQEMVLRSRGEQLERTQSLLRESEKEITTLRQENERLKETLNEIASTNTPYDAMYLKCCAREALKGE